MTAPNTADGSTSRRQLFAKLKEWGVGRNLRQHEMRAVLSKKEERMLNFGKDTEFFYHGQPLTAERLERFSQRPSGKDNSEELVYAGPNFFFGLKIFAYRILDTPPGVTYGTPKADSVSSLLHESIDVFYPLLLVLSQQDVELTNFFGCFPMGEPCPQQVTHRHQLGKLSMNLMGASTEESPENILFRFYQLGAELHRAVVSGRQESQGIPHTRRLNSTIPWACVVSSDDGIFNEPMKDSLIHQVKHMNLCQIVSSLLRQNQEPWDHDWHHLENEKAKDLRGLGEKLFVSNSSHYSGIAFLDLFMGHTMKGPTVMKISLGVDVQSGPHCSLCDLDVVTIDYLHSESAVTINIPLPRPGKRPQTKKTPYTWTTKQKGAWKSMGHQLKGWEASTTCRRKPKLAPQFELCQAQFEVVFEPGHWDPLGTVERPEMFQAHPRERGHICCNCSCRDGDDSEDKCGDECEIEHFKPAAQNGLTFTPFPNDEAVWDPCADVTDSLE